MKIWSILTVLVLLVGCGTVSTNHRPDSYYQGAHHRGASGLSFGDNAGGLNEEAIHKILDYRLVFAPENRVAILDLTQNNHWHYYSSSFIHLSEEMVEGLVGNLVDSSRVYDASFLPTLLVPRDRSLAELRSAAARYQADILLTYRTNCQSFEKYRFINPNVTRAYCTVEAVAIDIRSGIVPFSVVSTNEFTAEKSDDDLNFRETRQQAEIKAIAAGLREVSGRLREFIEGAPSL